MIHIPATKGATNAEVGTLTDCSSVNAVTGGVVNGTKVGRDCGVEVRGAK